ncbi:unnamed protein product [Fusarium venenatum]|uniref:Uncharacterized protein n=1 Tax=Fusarium venenatum TaxID=56646 RepID=A0A2L2SX44_9HYPO|nr:uncharacterized protein FVRRES_05645 [Fusarium venenatum]CEI61209.1 unnamed protein product [Fusarium venenatum]
MPWSASFPAFASQACLGNDHGYGTTGTPLSTHSRPSHRGVAPSLVPGLAVTSDACTTGFCSRNFLYPHALPHFPGFGPTVIDPRHQPFHFDRLSPPTLILTHACKLDDTERPSATPSAPSTPRSRSHARPIVIDLPQLKRFTSAPARTPPEPLSARGDLPGGYFPLHEDPTSRVHRPHPFQHHPDARMSRLISESGPIYADRPTSHPAQSALMSQSNTPVASYLAPGFHDNPLPMGKYYPSNYESRNGNQSNIRPPLNGTMSSNIGPDSQTVPRTSSQSTPETELRRKLQQYQRDMIAQASMAANELLSTSAKSGDKPSISLNSLPLRDSRFATAGSHKPISPRLLPLGSPGPVTPMDLESISSGDYLSR